MLVASDDPRTAPIRDLARVIPLSDDDSEAADERALLDELDRKDRDEPR